MKTISKVCLLALALGFITLNSCGKESISPTVSEVVPTVKQDGTITDQVTSRAPVIHHVSVGGSDICIDFFGTHPGCDGNFSLVANMKADGSVSGQYTDQFGHSNGGFHATVNCLNVVGNEAWVSGVITSGNIGGTDITGLPVITRVRDNGKSGDQISFSWIGDPSSCNDQLAYPLYGMTGQVKVW